MKTTVPLTEDVLLLDPRKIIIKEEQNIRYERRPAESVKDLARSFQADGQIHPVTVRLVDGEYHLVAGYRRHRAALLCQKTDKSFKLKAIVVEADDENALRLAVAENLERQNLSPIDVALAQKRLKDDYGWSDKAVAGFFKTNANTVSHMRRLLLLPEPVQKQVHEGTLGVEAAYQLSFLPAAEAIRMASTGQASAAETGKPHRMGRSAVIARKAKKARGLSAKPPRLQVEALLELLLESLEESNPLAEMAKVLLQFTGGKISLRTAKEALIDLAVES